MCVCNTHILIVKVELSAYIIRVLWDTNNLRDTILVPYPTTESERDTERENRKREKEKGRRELVRRFYK